MLNASSRNILSEAVFQGKSSKSLTAMSCEIKLYLVRFDKHIMNPVSLNVCIFFVFRKWSTTTMCKSRLS